MLTAIRHKTLLVLGLVLVALVMACGGTPDPVPTITHTLIKPPPMTSAEHECVIEALGQATWGQFLQGTRFPNPEEDDIIHACASSYVRGYFSQSGPDDKGAASPELDAPLPESPPDELISVTIGPVTITTYNPVTITRLENSTNLYFLARNNSTEHATIHFTSLIDIIQKKPDWIPHFFHLLKQQAGAPKQIVLGPGEEATLEFIVTNEALGETVLPFGFSVEETGEEETIHLSLRSVGDTPASQLPRTAIVIGHVLSTDGLPVANATVKLYLYNGKENWRTTTDSKGSYSISVPSTRDIRTILGPRLLPYNSLEYFLLVDVEGYKLAYKDGIVSKRNEVVTVDVSLQPKKEPTVSYRQIGELSTEMAHGYFWLLPNEDFSSLAAVQGRHPPELQLPGHFLMTNLQGQELWRYPTSDECWGFDVADDGRVAAGCHDNHIYVTTAEGVLLWELDVGKVSRHVQFSPDDRFLFTGPYAGIDDAVLLDATTGSTIWSYRGQDLWLRNSRFSPDGKRIVAGFSGGQLVMLDDKGTELWAASIGEFPMVLEIDADYNIYAAGKSRELFAFDASGKLRWRHRIGNHVVTAGSNVMSDNGQTVVLGTVGSWLLNFNKQGTLIWQRPLPQPSELQGHNALDVSPDGTWILAGTAGFSGQWLALYEQDGTLVWQQEFTDSRDRHTWPYQFDHNQSGPISVAISDDGRFVAAGFGDSTIRVFELE